MMNHRGPVYVILDTERWWPIVHHGTDVEKARAAFPQNQPQERYCLEVAYRGTDGEIVVEHDAKAQRLREDERKTLTIVAENILRCYEKDSFWLERKL